MLHMHTHELSSDIIREMIKNVRSQKQFGLVMK